MVKLLLIEVLPPFVLPDFRSELGVLQKFEVMQCMRISAQDVNIFIQEKVRHAYRMNRA